MAKFVEIPRAPQEVEAIQFQGVVDGLPKFGKEAVPDWFLAALVKGELTMTSAGEVFCEKEPVTSGMWLVSNKSKGSSLRCYPDAVFTAMYRRKRKLPVARKPRAVQAAA